MISILIPSRTDAYLERLIASIEESQPDWREKIHIVVVDDGLSVDCVNRSMIQDVWIAKGIKPFCFSRNINRAVSLMQYLHADMDFLIQNDDTEIKSPRFIDELEKIIPQMKRERWAIVSPQILGNCGNQEIMQPTPDDRLTELREKNISIPFISVLITAEAWRELGPLDERFDEGFAWEDVAFNIKAQRTGWKTGWSSAIKVWHQGHGTYQELPTDRLEQMSDTNREILRKHYGI